MASFYTIVIHRNARTTPDGEIFIRGLEALKSAFLCEIGAYAVFGVERAGERRDKNCPACG